MTKIKTDHFRAAGLHTNQSLEARGLPTVNNVKEGIEAHLQAFVDVHRSAELGKPVITAQSTREMLGALGIKTRAGGHILQKPFSIAQGHAEHADLARMKEGVREKKTGISAHTGTFEHKTGRLDPKEAVAFWKEVAGPKGYVTVDDVNRFVTGDKVVDLGLIHLRKPGKVVNELEFRLLFDMAAQVSDKGERVLTTDRFTAFIDGTLWQDLAKARKAGTLYQPRPVGEMIHEGSKKVAKGLAQLAATYGGTTADAGTSAAHQGALTIDTDASLKQQQKTKTLGPTIGGAMRALCPMGFG